MQELIDLVERTRAARLRKGPRPHLGCSEVGHDCDRAVWLSFRHAKPQEFSGRTYDKFRRGHHEETWIKADLEAVDLIAMNDQAPVRFSHHFKGSIDGELIFEGAPTLLECKCLEAKRVRALQRKGLEEAEPRAFVQVQLYMLGRGLEQCLYYAVNKDTSEPYIELIELDREFAENHRDRGLAIIEEPDIPPAIQGGGEDFFKCKICNYHGLCWDEDVNPEINCRTCRFSTPVEDGWRCEAGQGYHEEHACDKHQIHPGLVPWTCLGENARGAVEYEWEGKRFSNGRMGFSSEELLDGRC